MPGAAAPTRFHSCRCGPSIRTFPRFRSTAPGIQDTLARLDIRSRQIIQAKQGLSHLYTLDGITRRAYTFLFGGQGASSRDATRAAARSLGADPERAMAELVGGLGRRTDGTSARGAPGPFSLESPEQFSISWTKFTGVYEAGKQELDRWASSLTDADAATRQFWPMIASHGLGYNLIIPELVTQATAGALKSQFGAAWTREVRAALAAGDLYVIDMSRFETLQPQEANGVARFTPATVTLLTRNPRTKRLVPVAIAVSGYQGANRTVYSRETATNGAWLYALQAAKTSITVFGVWIGHVYHWHIVTAAMQMTMLNTLPATHPVYQLLAPQSRFAIPFDDVLLAAWTQIAPPTSLSTPEEFLGLINDYAAGRSYFDDDPHTTLDQLGLREGQFSVDEPWDRYPIVGRLLDMWDLVEPYVRTFVRTSYPSDAAVAADVDLQTWIATSGSADPGSGGNIRGLPQVDTRAALEKVLTSLLYRITIHGVSRLNTTSNPALTFVANFPHCLQRTNIPSPRVRIGTGQLLRYLPNTDAIAQAVNFYFTFAFSTPYEPFIPFGGVGEQLFFPGGRSDERNRALVDLRRGMARFINDYQPDMPAAVPVAAQYRDVGRTPVGLGPYRGGSHFSMNSRASLSAG